MFNDYYDRVQGSVAMNDMFGERSDNRPVAKAEAIKQVFGIDIKEENNGNDVQGSSVVDDGDTQSETGESGGQGESGDRGQSEEGAGTADGVRGREGSDTPARVTEAVIDLIY